MKQCDQRILDEVIMWEKIDNISVTGNIMEITFLSQANSDSFNQFFIIKWIIRLILEKMSRQFTI